jgi:hypothetical protein
MIWNSGYVSAKILNGTTKLMGNAVNGTMTALPANQYLLVSLVTTNNVQANQVCQDRSSHGSWQGDIAEILIYNSALTSDEEQRVGTYLSAKYGLTTAYPLLPAAPTGLTATAVSSNRIDLAWTDNATHAIGFKIERKTGGGTYSQIATVTADGSRYQDTGLAANTTYDYRVCAYNAAGDSGYCGEAGAVTLNAVPVNDGLVFWLAASPKKHVCE